MKYCAEGASVFLFLNISRMKRNVFERINPTCPFLGKVLLGYLGKIRVWLYIV